MRNLNVGATTAGLDPAGKGRPRIGGRSASWLAAIVLGLGATACGEITAFCLSAGAPDGVTMGVTITSTPNGNRITCGPVPPDSARRQGVAPLGHADGLEATDR